MIRQKTIHCGKWTKTYYREVDITMYKNTPRQRGKKRKPSLPKQERLNFKNSVRHLHQLCKSNFTGYDYRVDLTYDNNWLPDSLEAGRKYVDSYLRKVNNMRKKKGLPPAGEQRRRQHIPMQREAEHGLLRRHPMRKV